MSTSFQTNMKSLYTSECVTEGHPDKVCDQISDGVVDWCLAQNPEGRVACEAAIKSDDARDWVAVFGECTPLPPEQEVVKIVRDTLRRIGYTERSFGTCCDTAEIEVVSPGSRETSHRASTVPWRPAREPPTTNSKRAPETRE